MAEVNFDADGKPIGLVYRVKVNARVITLSGSAAALMISSNPQNQGQQGA